MSAFTKFNQFVQDVFNKKHDFSADVFKVCLTNTAPTSSNAVYTDIADLSTGNGYTAGGATVTTVSSTQTGGTETYIGTLANPTWTATGAVGPFRYAVFYNSTQTSPAKPLVGYWDYGSSVTLAATNTFTVSLDPVNGVLQAS